MKQFLMVMLAFSIALPSFARARRERSYTFALTTVYNTYTDIQQSESVGASADLEPSMDIELALRLINYFQLIAVSSTSENSLRKTYGGGFRIDLPGFFFMFSRYSQARYRRKLYPVTSSIYGLVYSGSRKATENSVEEDLSGTEMGVTVDTFLFNPNLYLRLQGAVLNEQANTYSSFSAGLGVEF